MKTQNQNFKNEEIEIKFLEIDPIKIQKKLKKIGAKKVSDMILQEWLFNKPEWEKIQGRVRIRKSDKVEITYKQNGNKNNKGDLEIEFVAEDNIGEILKFFEKIGLKNPRKQEKRRIKYKLNKVTYDIDFWPKIHPLLEIEGPSWDAVVNGAKLLGFDPTKGIKLNIAQIYKEFYKIDIHKLKNLTFNNEKATRR